MGLRTRLVAGVIALALLLAACSSTFDDGAADTAAPAPPEEGGKQAFVRAEVPVGAPTVDEEATNEFDTPPDSVYPQADIRVIRDGRIDLRIPKNDFGQVSADLRTLAADLGGYISSGETHLEEIEGVSYAVGWFTLRIPEVRFEEALDRAEGLGERIGLTVSSQDVSEEFVDLEGRLAYWKAQEAFYLRLMDETDDISQLVALQNQMRDVLLEIEAIEGRMRYLDGRTTFSTLTVGLTEVPGAAPVVPEEPVAEPGILMEALETAGTVLLSVIAFLIVAAAFALPLAIVALIAYGLWRAFGGGRKDPTPTEA